MRITFLLTIKTLILCFSALAQVPAYVPSQGLLAWYGFSGNANDASGNGNNLTNNGATLTADRYGNANSAYQFNGTSGYLVNTTPGFIVSDTSSFTLSVWVYRPSTTYGVYIMHGSTVGGNFNYNIQGSATGITNFGANKQGSAWIWCAAPYSSGIWEHYAGTYENKILKLYKNGVLISSNNYTHTNVNATTLPWCFRELCGSNPG